MKRIRAAGALGMALAFAVPAWAQSTTATDPNGSALSTGPGVNSSLPGGANTAVGRNSNEVQTTHLRAECFDVAANVWRTTADCAPGTSLSGTHAPTAINSGGSINGAAPSSAGTTLPATPTQPGTVR